MKFPRLLALFLIPVLAFAQKPTPEDEKAVLETEYAWCQAYLKGDHAALADIELDGFTYTGPTGTITTKSQEIAELKSGAIRYEKLSSHELSVRVYGDTALVNGRTVLKAVHDGEPHEGIFQFTDTFVRQNGRWRVAAEHASRVAPTSNYSTEPLPRDGGWLKRHESFLEIAKKGGVDVLFLGDSITDNWRKPDYGLPVWEKHFAPLRAANFGISGDRTQHVLWRMQNGELDGIAPRVVVLMIGTNNTGFERDNLTPRNTNADIVAGITAIVDGLKTKLPETKVLLLAIFPRAEKPDAPARLQVNAVNAAIAGLHDGKRVFFLDIGDKFLAPDGTLPKEIMPDFLHPGSKGYEIWAAAIEKPLTNLLK